MINKLLLYKSIINKFENVPKKLSLFKLVLFIDNKISWILILLWALIFKAEVINFGNIGFDGGLEIILEGFF